MEVQQEMGNDLNEIKGLLYTSTFDKICGKFKGGKSEKIHILNLGTFINDVSCFLAISDLPTYLVLLYNVPFLGLSWTPLPTLIRDVINERSLLHIL